MGFIKMYLEFILYIAKKNLYAIAVARNKAHLIRLILD